MQLFGHARGKERNAELSRSQDADAARWIAGLPTAPKVRRILDIGSGPGVTACLLAEVFPEAEVVAVDGTAALLERTRARAQRLGLGDRVRTQQAEIPHSIERSDPTPWLSAHQGRDGASGGSAVRGAVPVRELRLRH